MVYDDPAVTSEAEVWRNLYWDRLDALAVEIDEVWREHRRTDGAKVLIDLVCLEWRLVWR